MPSTVLKALPGSLYLIFTAMLSHRAHRYPHYTDRKSEDDTLSYMPKITQLERDGAGSQSYFVSPEFSYPALQRQRKVRTESALAGSLRIPTCPTGQFLEAVSKNGSSRSCF